MKIIVAFVFFLVAPASFASTPFITTPECSSLFALEPSVADRFFDRVLSTEKTFTQQRTDEIKNTFVNYLRDVPETTPMFSYFGESISRLFLKTEVQYAPLNLLLQGYLSPREKQELLRKLFRSGYVLSKGSEKYPDTGDVDALMKDSNAELLEIALQSSERNRDVLRKHFDPRPSQQAFWHRTLTATPLHTLASGEAYAPTVLAKLKMLHAARVDLTAVLEGVTSSSWMSTTSDQRVQIASALPYELSTPGAINHLFRETETTTAGVTALMYAISAKDQPLVDAYRKYGAEADIVVPDQTNATTIEHQQWASGETIRQLAKRLKVKLPY